MDLVSFSCLSLHNTHLDQAPTPQNYTKAAKSFNQLLGLCILCAEEKSETEKLCPTAMQSGKIMVCHLKYSSEHQMPTRLQFNSDQPVLCLQKCFCLITQRLVMCSQVKCFPPALKHMMWCKDRSKDAQTFSKHLIFIHRITHFSLRNLL